MPLLVGAGVLLGSMLLYALCAALIVDLFAPLIRSRRRQGFWQSVGVMMVVTLITAAAHLGAITLWAAALLMCGEISIFDKAWYLSAQNYTALGYGDILPSERWRLLGPLEALNGLLLVGLSTALMFAVLNHLITNRLRHSLLSENDLTTPGIYP
jgi:hypothetical protein